MSSYATPPSSTLAASATSSTVSDPTPTKDDHRILIVVVVLGIIAAFLVAFILYITLRVRRRQSSGENSGPYAGTVMHHDHPAAHITPFGNHSGGNRPSFNHKPGEDMRIAIRRPDGAWHFTDSRTPFTPSGVSDIDVLPSPISSSTSLMSFNSRLPLNSKKSLDGKMAREYNKGYDPDLDFELSPTVPPPPAYHHFREPCRDYFEEARSPI